MKPTRARKRHRRRIADDEARKLRALDFIRYQKGGMATDDIGRIYCLTGRHVRGEITWFRRLAREARKAREEEADDLG